MTVADNFRTKGATEKGAAEASVLIAGTRYDLPMRKGTLGPDVIDVGTLYQDCPSSEFLGQRAGSFKGGSGPSAW